MRRVWIAVGAGGALLTATLLAFTLMPASPKATETEADGAQARAPGAVAAPGTQGPALARAARPVSGGVNTPEAKEAWLREHFGPDLNPEGVEAREVAPLGMNANANVPPAAPPGPPLPPVGTYERFEVETDKMVEHFPDAKDAVDEMKAEIAAAQLVAKLAAEKAAAEQAQQ